MATGLKRLLIKKAQDNMASEIYSLASRMDFSNLSIFQRKDIGFIFKYSLQDYQRFIGIASYFYVLVDCQRIVGFVLAQESDSIPDDDMEAYLHMRSTHPRPFFVVRQICIDAQYTGYGFGRLLYTDLFSQFRPHREKYKCSKTFIWT